MPFDDRLAYLTPVEDASLWYGEFTTFGNFAYHFAREDYHVVEEGVDPMYPHIGRHIGHETENPKSRGRREASWYFPVALKVGVCQLLRCDLSRQLFSEMIRPFGMGPVAAILSPQSRRRALDPTPLTSAPDCTINF